MESNYGSEQAAVNVKYREDPGLNEPKRMSEIDALCRGLDEIITDIGEEFGRLQDRIIPVTNPHRDTPLDPQGRDKRGCETPLGTRLGEMLDRLQTFRDRIQTTTNMVEL